ncbi:hypothetical protein DICVIV_05798 [Dictyocaulus viviparus]|uniref:Mini-chromosome maintenance complex-binding protein n=1 Tax=Dictyocaulus viviparus TaxID=29172 RepID=A0A0D8XW99_DICVI|nr:hypothetical protein DICVIV_05798 [Dictyocaulus viviparus]
MAPAPETASADFMKVVDDMWQKNGEMYLTSPCQFFREINEIFSNNKSFVSLHTSEVSPGYLVAARCMIQNTLTPEYFPLKCTAIKGSLTQEMTGCYRDTFDDDVTDIVDSGKHAIRFCYKMVTVPGAVDWWLNNLAATHTTECKLINGEMHEFSTLFPVKVTDFIAKVFDDGSPELKPNTVVDVYGYLYAPLNTIDENESSRNFTVHVLRISEVSHVAPEMSLKGIDLPSIRCDLVKDISLVLGSVTSADIFVNFLISTTYAHPEGGTPLCFVPLNIIGFEDSEAVDVIVKMIQHIMPKVKVLTLTPELLSQKRFAPFKDYASDELLQGELQLSSGTVLIIDETQLPTGTFPVNGFVEENLIVLGDLIVNQRMNYDYSFYKLPMEVDYNILIISKKESRFFKTPFRIPFRQSESVMLFNDVCRKRSFLQQSRIGVRSVCLREDISGRIQDSFVTMCSSLDKKIDKASFLNELLIMSRLVAASNGSPCVELEHWEHAVRIYSANVSACMSLLQ